MSLFPFSHPELPAQTAATLQGLLSAESRCLLSSLSACAPIVAFWIVTQRSRRWMFVSTVQVAVAAALVGFLSLELHCPAKDPAHLLAGHFGTFVLVVGSLAAWALSQED
jgi:hypothetical protein